MRKGETNRGANSSMQGGPVSSSKADVSIINMINNNNELNVTPVLENAYI
jgi:hypothetical protein